MTSSPRILHAATGSNLTAKGWAQEAAIRMLHNNLDPAVAEHPENLVVYGGTGKAARNWPSFDAIVKSLTNLKDDETLLVQSGKPVGVFQTHEWAPRVLIANSNLVGDWANWPEFRRLEQLGLTMYGQMTAGSWIYIGTQGILQGTYETFAAVAQKRFNGTLQGTLTLTGGCGGMGGAQPLAVTMNGGVCLVIDIDKTRLEKRIETRYLDEIADNVDDAIERVLKAKAAKVPLSVGLEGNAAELFPLLLSMDVPIDIVTDQTSAHDPFSYVPVGVSVHDAARMAKDNPEDFTKRSQALIQSVMKPAKAAFHVLLPSQALFQPIFVHSFVKEKAHFVGWHYLEILKIFIEQIKQFLICSQKMKVCIAGSPWLKRKLLSKDFLPVFVG